MEMIEKPSGKCSHGGYFDSSSDFHARGGINKDSLYPIICSLHFEAARLAKEATAKILREIAAEVGDAGKFAAFLNSSYKPMRQTGT